MRIEASEWKWICSSLGMTLGELFPLLGYCIGWGWPPEVLPDKAVAQLQEICSARSNQSLERILELGKNAVSVVDIANHFNLSTSTARAMMRSTTIELARNKPYPYLWKQDLPQFIRLNQAYASHLSTNPLWRWRRDNGLKLREGARILKIAPSTLIAYEAGVLEPDRRVKDILARKYRVSKVYGPIGWWYRKNREYIVEAIYPQSVSEKEQ